MREIKFQFLYKGLPFSGANEGFNWHKKVYSLDQLIEKPLSQLSDAHGQSELIAKRQYTGLKDKNGKEIYEGDIVEQDKNCMFNDGKLINMVSFDGRDKFVSGFCSLYQAVNSFNAVVIGNIYENPELIGDT